MSRRRRLWRRIGFGNLFAYHLVLASRPFDVLKVCILSLQIGSGLYELKAVEFIILSAD